jgi:hypothetical protein
MPQRLHAWLLWHMTIWTRLQFLATTGSRRKILSFVVSWNGRSRTKKFCPYPKGTCPHARLFSFSTALSLVAPYFSLASPKP